MIRKLAPAAVAVAALVAPVAVTTATATTTAHAATPAAVQTTYGNVTAKHLLVRSDLMFPNRAWSSVTNASQEPQATGTTCQLHPTGRATSMASGSWYGKDPHVWGAVEATRYASVAQAQAAMRSMIPQLTRCSYPERGARTTPSRMTLQIRMADAEIGSVYKVRQDGITRYEYVGAVRVGNRVETIAVSTPSRFSGDVSRFAYQMSLAAKKLHNR